MIEKKDVEHLARLAQIAMDDAEKEKLTADLEAVLGYISEIKEVNGARDTIVPAHRNSMREDVSPHESGVFSENLLKQAPMRNGNYVQVKKILKDGR